MSIRITAPAIIEAVESVLHDVLVACCLEVMTRQRAPGQPQSHTVELARTDAIELLASYDAGPFGENIRVSRTIAKQAAADADARSARCFPDRAALGNVLSSLSFRQEDKYLRDNRRR